MQNNTIFVIIVMLTMVSFLGTFVNAYEMENSFAVLNRTSSTVEYMNLTSNDTLIVLYPRDVFMLNSSGSYRPYSEVTSFTSTQTNLTVSWYGKSILFKIYTKNQSGSKEYLIDKTGQQLLNLNLTTSIDSDVGGYSYTHSLTTNISSQPYILGYDFTTQNVNCTKTSSYILQCGEQKLNFGKAFTDQNITVNLTSSTIEFMGSNLSFIDPTVTLNGSAQTDGYSVWYDSGLDEYDGDFDTGGTDQNRVGSDCYSSCTEHENYRAWFGYVTTSLSTQWHITNIDFRWYDDYEADDGSDTVGFYQMFESDFLHGDHTPSGDDEGRVTYGNIGGSENDYGSDGSPDENSYNTQTLSSIAKNRLESDIKNKTHFYVGLKNPSGGNTDNYIDIPDELSTHPPSLIVTYTTDTTAPTTSASATSPPGVSSYSFNTWSRDEVRLSLSCSDSGGSWGCNTTKYCIDQSNSCTPSSIYSGYINHSSTGTYYLRYLSIDYDGNSEGTHSSIIKIDKASGITLASATTEGNTYIFGNIANDTVQVNLTCSDSLSGCSFIKYCVDTTQSCVPNVTYSSSVIVNNSGTSYLRFFGKDSASNYENINNKQIIINKVYPQKVTVSVDVYQIFSEESVLQNKESTKDFSNEINVYLQNCTVDAEGYCLVPINVHSDAPGTVNISSLDISFNASSYIWNVSGLLQLSTYRVRVQSTDGQLNSTFDASDADFSIGYFNTTPSISFVSPTPANNSQQNVSLPINISSSDPFVHYTFLDLDRSLVLWMRMDDKNGNKIMDLSSYANNGTLKDNANVSEGGYWGKKLDLDGNGDFINLSKPTSLQFSNEPFTIASWAYLVSNSSSFGRIVGADNGGSNGEGYRLGVDTGINKWFFNFENGTAGTGVSSTTNLSYNGWTFVVGQYNGTHNLIYINGNLENSTYVGQISPNWSAVSEIEIGRRPSSNAFNGSIDEVIIFGRALLSEEIRSLYSATVNQYYNNFTGLSYTNHTFKGYSVNTLGNRNSTEERRVTLLNGGPQDQNKFIVMNATSGVVAWFGNLGNIVLAGSCASSSNCNSIDINNPLQFIVKNNSGVVTLSIDSRGNLCTRSSNCNSLSSSCNPTSDAFIIRNSSSANMTYILEVNGSLCYKGNLYENSSQYL